MLVSDALTHLKCKSQVFLNCYFYNAINFIFSVIITNNETLLNDVTTRNIRGILYFSEENVYFGTPNQFFFLTMAR